MSKEETKGKTEQAEGEMKKAEGKVRRPRPPKKKNQKIKVILNILFDKSCSLFTYFLSGEADF